MAHPRHSLLRCAIVSESHFRAIVLRYPLMLAGCNYLLNVGGVFDGKDGFDGVVADNVFNIPAGKVEPGG